MIKVVCIGAGYFAPFHLDAWNRIPEVQLLGLCDLNLDKAIALANQFKIPNTFADIEEMLQMIKPDVIDIITPPGSHLNLCRKAAALGTHIICQKPLAPTLSEAKEIVEVANSAQIRFMVHENFRFQPWYREIKRLINAQVIGDKIHQLYFRMRTGDGWQPDAYLNRQPYFRKMPKLLIFETGIHFIDTFRYLCGEIKDIKANLRRLNPAIAGEDTALLIFEFTNGALGIWDANRYNEPRIQNARYTFGELWLEGNQGAIRLYQDGTLTLQTLGSTEKTLEYHHEDRNFAGDCVYYTQYHFIDCLINNKPFETSGEDYLKNLDWQEYIYEQSL